MENSTLQDSLAGLKMPELNHTSRALVSVARVCRNERSDPNFADEHDGETFEEFYAEGPADSAFANCLAAKSS
jgi:hypothetical protein